MEHPIQQINFTNPNSAWLIEASAGTGKTWTIERLFIKALLEINQVESKPPLEYVSGLVTIDNILVVTFTNDATDELKSRIYEQLQATIDQIIYLANNKDIIHGQNDPFTSYLINRYAKHDHVRDLSILAGALQSFDMASIYTIHGLCHRLLQDYPLECFVNNSFEIRQDNKDIYITIITEFIHKQVMTNPDLSSNLAIILDNLNDEKLFGDRNNHDLDLVERIAGSLPKDLFTINLNKYQLNYQIHYKQSLELLATKLHSIEEKSQAKGEFLACLINYMHIRYQVIVKAKNILSFNEIIQSVVMALANNKELANQIFARFPIAFIDEFQDTDNQQLELFDLIYQLNTKARGYVIVVGDPKQAIYRFRGASIDSYISARKKINNHLSLNVNYRTNYNIMNFINQLFCLANQGSLVNNSFLGSEINYEANTAINNKTSLDLIPSKELIQQVIANKGVNAKFYDEDVQLVVIKGKGADQRQKQLLNALTFEILALINAKDQLKGKIAILVTKNYQATEIVNHLRYYGLRATEVKLGIVFAQQSANDLYIILSSIFDSANLDMFSQAIATKFFNIPLVNLHNKQQNEIISQLRKNFFDYKHIWSSNGLLALTYRLLDDINKNNSGLDKRELANIWQLAELLNKHDQKINNQMELLYWFKSRIDSANENIQTELDGNNEELIRLDNDEEQIIVTTQHKAKGLEYEILFCPYFKSNIELDSTLGYQRPFFSNYIYNNEAYSDLVSDLKVAQAIIAEDNKEAHRLNYVSLTRAKTRIYIYLKQNSYLKNGKYNPNQKPDKIAELFGYCANDPADSSHKLFNYPQFFGNTPELAIKNSQLLLGVVTYNRDNLTNMELDKLSLSSFKTPDDLSQVYSVKLSHLHQTKWYRQSYSKIIKTTSIDDKHDYYEDNYLINETKNTYQYSILNDSIITGATFGVLFHELCEAYPVNEDYIIDKLRDYNISSDQVDIYVVELIAMLDKSFNYPLFDGMTLNNLAPLTHEIEFNLAINSSLNLSDQLGQLITKHFGNNHPFSLAVKDLDTILPGFLMGFIDLVVVINGKYWVIDYKTNTLESYTSNLNNNHDYDNPLLQSMANHHYYLQYLLYLVALKRYLELHLHIDNASNLLGGSLYYYVRGIYTVNSLVNDGIYIDDNPQVLVSQIDDLFKGNI